MGLKYEKKCLRNILLLDRKKERYCFKRAQFRVCVGGRGQKRMVPVLNLNIFQHALNQDGGDPWSRSLRVKIAQTSN
jgi:hypothetical protein